MTNRSVIIALYLLVVLNIMDASVTLVCIDLGIAEEINPLMKFFLEKGKIWFILAKFTGVLTACYIFWRFRAEKAAQIGLKIAVVAYLLLFSYFCIELL